MYFYSELGVKMFRQMLCGIDRTVLSSRTSETNHQIGESTIHISFYRGVYDMVDMLEEVRDLPSSSKNWITGSSKPVKWL